MDGQKFGPHDPSNGPKYPHQQIAPCPEAERGPRTCSAACVSRSFPGDVGSPRWARFPFCSMPRLGLLTSEDLRRLQLALRSGAASMSSSPHGAATGKGKLRAALADFQCLPLFIFKAFSMCMGTSWSHVTQAGLDYVAEDDL